MTTTFRRGPVDSVVRQRVIERLARAVQFKLTVVAAPAGFGKTVALRQFAAAATEPVVTVDLGAGVASPVELTLAVARALEPLVPGVLDAVTVAAAAGGEAAPAALCEGSRSLRALVALDGFTGALLADDAVRRCVVELVERSGAGLHWLIAVRAPGLLPIATWMGYGQMDAPVDERDLGLSPDEAAAVAQAIAPAADQRLVDELHAMTGGWPTPFVLGLRTPRHGDATGAGGLSNQPLIAQFLAEHVFAELDADEQAFALATGVMATIDAELVPQVGTFAMHEMLERVRKRVSLVWSHGNGIFAYHPLLRAFFEYELRRRGDAAYRAALVQAAEAFERAEHFGAALETYVRGAAADDVERTLERHGFELVERGEIQSVVAAIAVLQRAKRAAVPPVLSLRALVESNRGNFTRADALFEQSVDAARDATERLELLKRFALDLIKRNDPLNLEHLRNTVARLDAAAAASTTPHALQVEVLGTLAIMYIMVDKLADAQTAIGSALAKIGVDDNPRLQATIYHQASYVAYVVGDAARGARLAATASRLALEQQNYRLAVRSASIRYSIAMGLEDDPDRAFDFLEEMSVAATIAGDQVLKLEALAGQLDIAAERGDDDALARIERLIDDVEHGVDVFASTLDAAKATQAAWQGNFRRAYELIASSAREQGSPLRRALRAAEIAVYAGAAGEREIAAQNVSDALQGARSVVLRTVEDRRRQAKTFALAAVAYLVIGNAALANGLLSELERSRREMSPRVRALVEAVRALYLRIEIESDEGLAATREQLLAVGYGGLARIFDALPLAGGEAGASIGLLTPSEITVLRVLARGGSSTKVAAELGRSVNTVNAHVKSIMRKLGCTSRHEAVAIAREHGLIR